MSLAANLIDRIFVRLTGIYGSQFTSKFRHVENGLDVGMANAKETWANELRNFGDRLDAIAYALEHLPTDHAPNAIEFRDICRRAPAKEIEQRIEYKPTAEDVAHHREMSRKAADAVKSPVFDGMLWAKRPKSQIAMNALYDAKKNQGRFPALAAIFDQHVRDGIASEAGKILARWDGLAWVKP